MRIAVKLLILHAGDHVDPGVQPASSALFPRLIGQFLCMNRHVPCFALTSRAV